MKIAFHTLGCKVNQYDTQAMRELFLAAGHSEVGFHEEADVYLINTCTVTGTGDNKCLKTIRRAHREHPQAAIVVAGCLAQRDAELVSLPGVRLILGTKNRAHVVTLLDRALNEGALINAVDAEQNWSFEKLAVTSHEGKTRAVMKIQEGCDRFCAYCIIPHVRGTVRSMPLDEVRQEAQRLADQGYKELVLTGIHLTSYGRGEGVTLLDAVGAVHDIPGVSRIRLGSLEPTLIDEHFVAEAAMLPKLCPQFHLSMQSGSATVLQRMRRRYTPDEYLAAARLLQGSLENCAITTDVLTGFPGETDQEAQETLDFVEQIGFSRIHVFPYSRRAGTPADRMEGQVPEQIKQKRAAELIELGNQLEIRFVEKLIGTSQQVLLETALPDGRLSGYSAGYVRVVIDDDGAQPGELVQVRIESARGDTAHGRKAD